MRRRELLAAAAVLAGAAPAVAQTALVRVRLASNATDDVVPVLWAQHEGLFVKAGLDVSITRMNSGAAVTAAVVGGAIEIGKSSLLPLIAAHARDVPLTIIAPGELWLTSAPLSGLLTLKTSPLTTAKDLNGKTIATAALNDLSWVAAHAWIDKHGGDSKTVRFVEIPASAALASLVDGRVDAATIQGPNYAAALASGKVKILAAASDAIAPHYLATAWFATNGWIAKAPAAAADFARIVEQTAQFTNVHHAETVPLLADFTGIEPAVLAQMNHGVCGTGLDAKDIQPVVDVAVTYQVIPRRFDARELLPPGADDRAPRGSGRPG